MARAPSGRTPARGGVLVARVFGIELRIDATWVVSILVLSAFSYQLITPNVLRHASLPAMLAVSVGFGLIISACIVAHEVAHSLIAIGQGLPVRGITLFMFGGVSQIEREAPNPAAEYRVALAGPLLSVLLAGAFAAVARLLNPGVAQLVGGWGWLAIVNLWLAIFNLLPAFPMDGGRILRSALWAGAHSRGRATRWAALVGRGFAGILIAYGVVSVFRSAAGGNGVWTVMLGLFLYSAARAAGVDEGAEHPNEPTQAGS